jgi:hypothetical protein
LPTDGFKLLNEEEMKAIIADSQSTADQATKILEINKIITNAVLRAKAYTSPTIKEVLGQAKLYSIQHDENGTSYYLLDYVLPSNYGDLEAICKSGANNATYEKLDSMIVYLVTEAPFVTHDNLCDRVIAIKPLNLNVVAEGFIPITTTPRPSGANTPSPDKTVSPYPTSKPPENYDVDEESESFVVDENGNRLGRIFIEKDSYGTVLVEAHKGRNPKFKYSISDSKIVTIDDEGNIKGKSAGRTTLTISITYDGNKYEELRYTVICRERGNFVSLAPSNVNMNVGDYLRLNVSKDPADIDMVFYSTNSRVAICASDGTILATGQGECEIYAQNYDVTSNKVKVIVN